MSIRRNIIANYASQAYISAVGIALLPLYVEYMGTDAYGLIGFFSVLQAWFSLLDAGLSPAISRETARYHAGALAPPEFLRLFRALNLLFILAAAFGGMCLYLANSYIVTAWLNIGSLSQEEVLYSLNIMALTVALRLIGALYRGVITGAEKFIWLSGFNSLITSIRFLGVFFSMERWGFSPEVFFTHQLVVAVVESGALYWRSVLILPNRSYINERVGLSLTPMKPILRFSLPMACTSLIWIMITQTDRFVLSGILSLTDYGYFTMAVLAASGVTTVAGPISNAIMPRLAKHHAAADRYAMLALYRSSTRWVTAIAGTIALTMFVAAKPLVFAWSGSLYLAERVAPILQLYVLGNLVLTVSAFPFYLQYALGNIRYHVIGNIGLATFLFPCIVFATKNFGAIGAGFVWLGVNLTYFVFWIPYVHSKVAPGMHLQWLKVDVFRTLVFPTVLSAFIFILNIGSEDRVSAFIYTLAVGMTVAFAASRAHAEFKEKIAEFFFVGKSS